VSFGLWEERYDLKKSPFELGWLPEINLVHEYAAQDRSTWKSVDDFENELRRFCMTMWQNTIFVLWNDGNGLAKAFFYNAKRLKDRPWPPVSISGQPLQRDESDYVFEWTGNADVVHWRFQVEPARKWEDQFFLFRAGLAPRLKGDVPSHLERLMDQAMSEGMERFHGLGGTFQASSRDPSNFDVLISGGARFFFAPYFWNVNDDPTFGNQPHHELYDVKPEHLEETLGGPRPHLVQLDGGVIRAVQYLERFSKNAGRPGNWPHAYFHH
jgi:hypothetical protein